MARRNLAKKCRLFVGSLGSSWRRRFSFLILFCWLPANFCGDFQQNNLKVNDKVAMLERFFFGKSYLWWLAEKMWSHFDMEHFFAWAAKKNTHKNCCSKKRQPQVTGRNMIPNSVGLRKNPFKQLEKKNTWIWYDEWASVDFMPFSKQKSEQLSPKILFRIELSLIWF